MLLQLRVAARSIQQAAMGPRAAQRMVTQRAQAAFAGVVPLGGKQGAVAEARAGSILTVALPAASAFSSAHNSGATAAASRGGHGALAQTASSNRGVGIAGGAPSAVARSSCATAQGASDAPGSASAGRSAVAMSPRVRALWEAVTSGDAQRIRQSDLVRRHVREADEATERRARRIREWASGWGSRGAGPLPTMLLDASEQDASAAAGATPRDAAGVRRTADGKPLFPLATMRLPFVAPSPGQTDEEAVAAAMAAEGDADGASLLVAEEESPIVARLGALSTGTLVAAGTSAGRRQRQGGADPCSADASAGPGGRYSVVGLRTRRAGVAELSLALEGATDAKLHAKQVAALRQTQKAALARYLEPVPSSVRAASDVLLTRSESGVQPVGPVVSRPGKRTSLERGEGPADSHAAVSAAVAAHKAAQTDAFVRLMDAQAAAAREAAAAGDATSPALSHAPSTLSAGSMAGRPAADDSEDESTSDNGELRLLREEERQADGTLGSATALVPIGSSPGGPGSNRAVLEDVMRLSRRPVVPPLAMHALAGSEQATAAGDPAWADPETAAWDAAGLDWAGGRAGQDQLRLSAAAAAAGRHAAEAGAHSVSLPCGPPSDGFSAEAAGGDIVGDALAELEALRLGGGSSADAGTERQSAFLGRAATDLGGEGDESDTESVQEMLRTALFSTGRRAGE